MSKVTITDSASSQSGAMGQDATVGHEGVGQHLTGTFTNEPSGSAGADTDITRALVPDLIKTGFDDKVVKMGFTTGQINAMTREIGYRPIKSMVYGYYSVDLRPIKETLAKEYAVTAANAGRKIPSYATIEVTAGAASMFDKTDVISFRGVNGYSADGKELNYVSLNARVCEVLSDGKSLKVQFLNANPKGQTIAEGTEIYILGHAACEVDASTVPYAALPDKQEQYMQKFMVQSLISSVMMESEKEVEWGKTDINELLMQQFIEDIEKFYVFGVKSYTFDPTTKLYTRTTSGIIEQMIEGGSKIVNIYKEDLKFADFLNAVNETFVGNTGSAKRYMFNGCNVAPAIWGITDITKMVGVKEYGDCFGYDFTGFDVLGYQLVHVPYPLLDRMNRKDWSLVLDRQYVERRVFRSMDETILELKKTGAYDGESTVLSEISSVVLKYPQVHALWIFHDGKKPAA
jgi:hypothetical protein